MASEVQEQKSVGRAFRSRKKQQRAAGNETFKPPDAAESSQAEKSSDTSTSLCRGCLGYAKYLLVFILLPPFLNYASLQQEARLLQPTGALYDVGFGQKMQLSCLGDGVPTVILDSPTGMSSDAWAAVQPEIAKLTTVCVYDRAGLGFSERPPWRNDSASDQEDPGTEGQEKEWKEFTVERMADDLHRLMTFSSQQKEPFILVGAEMGALVARFYTQLYETSVTDLVLIEPLVEDIFTQDEGVWLQFWFGHLVPSFQFLQLAAATGLTRVLLLFGLIEQPITGDLISDDVISRQKHLMCNPRHMSSVVDEHHFLNESIIQTNLLMRMKQFPSNISVTVINGNYFDEQLPGALNKAWAKSQQRLMTHLHPGSKHIVVNGADHKMLYRQPDAVIEPIRRVIKQRRAAT